MDGLDESGQKKATDGQGPRASKKEALSVAASIVRTQKPLVKPESKQSDQTWRPTRRSPPRVPPPQGSGSYRQAAIHRLVEVAQQFVERIPLRGAAGDRGHLGPVPALFGFVDHDAQLHGRFPIRRTRAL